MDGVQLYNLQLEQYKFDYTAVGETVVMYLYV